MANQLPRRGMFLLGIPLHALYEQSEASPWLPNEDPALVKEMVGVSHRDVKRVRELVDQRPSLVKAAIDWGFGDWESALGAASHVGNRDVAELLLERGAEPTIFSATMLGQLDVVKALVTAQPGVQRKLGPHGIPLLNHAKAGGEKSAAVFKYLTELGDAGIGLPVKATTPEERALVSGKYQFGPGNRDFFEIDSEKEQLGINRPGAPARVRLHHSGGFEFYPAGAPWAKIVMQREAGKVTGFTLGSLTAKKI